jgi:hypothetical protein
MIHMILAVLTTVAIVTWLRPEYFQDYMIVVAFLAFIVGMGTVLDSREARRHSN